MRGKFGKELADLRQKKGLTHYELAKRVQSLAPALNDGKQEPNVDSTYFRNLEIKGFNPRERGRIMQISKAMRLDIEETNQLLKAAGKQEESEPPREDKDQLVALLAEKPCINKSDPNSFYLLWLEDNALKNTLPVRGIRELYRDVLAHAKAHNQRIISLIRIFNFGFGTSTQYAAFDEAKQSDDALIPGIYLINEFEVRIYCTRAEQSGEHITVIEIHDPNPQSLRSPGNLRVDVTYMQDGELKKMSKTIPVTAESQRVAPGRIDTRFVAYLECPAHMLKPQNIETIRIERP